jgi:hypothetical protein
VRIFKTKALARFARQQGIGDDSLVAAVRQAMQGLIDADLGGRVIKQRVARPGEGKRGGFRMLIGFGSDRAVFLYGFAKNERENISNSELLSLREIAATFLNASKDQIARALKYGTLIEVYDDSKEEKDGYQ